MESHRIEQYLGASCLVPELACLSWERFIKAQRNITFSHNRRCHKISLMVRGPVHWWVEREKVYLPSRYIMITQPGEEHGSIDKTVECCELFWLQIDGSLMPREGGYCKGLLDQLHSRKMIAQQDIVKCFQMMMNECRTRDQHSAMAIRGQLMCLFTRLLRQQDNDKRPSCSKSFEKLLEWIQNHIYQNPSLDEIAHQAHCSRSTLHELFQNQLGQAPGAYLKRQRIEVAKSLLLNKKLGITSIAYQLNYSSSQHFSNAFKNMTGFRPSDWRELGV